MNNDIRILVVDDEPLNLDIMNEYLDEHYKHIEFLEDGLKCLEFVKHNPVDVLLLDVSMPIMDGYEVCRRIRKSHPEISVIFVSARGSAEERIQGYEAGGVDYVVKPFKESELFQKLDRVITYHKEKEILKEQIQYAQSSALEAMTNSSEMGQVVMYLRQLFTAETIDDINQLTIQFCQTLGLKAVVMSQLEKELFFQSHAGTPSPLEMDLIQLLEHRGRLFSFDHRLQVNFSNISLLIKNMPTESDTKMGRFRDILPIALEGAEQSIKAISMRTKVLEYDELSDILNVVNTISLDIKHNLHSVDTECREAINALNHTIDNKVPYMGLEDNQEEIIIESADKVAVRMRDALELLKDVAAGINAIKQELSKKVT